MLDDNQTSERVLAATLGRAADLRFDTGPAGARLVYWRSLIAPLSFSTLPEPAVVASLPAHEPAQPGVDLQPSSPIVRLIGADAFLSLDDVEGRFDLAVITFGRSPPQCDDMKRALEDALGAALLRQVLTEAPAASAADKRLYLQTLLRALAAHVSQGAPPEGRGRLPVSDSSAYRLHKVLDALRQRPGDPHPIEEMAAAAGLTPNHFAKIFKSAMGVPPRQYLLKLRVEQAMRLMADPALSLASIAEDLGFDSLSHFSRVFRAHTAETPGAYRRRGDRTLH